MRKPGQEATPFATYRKCGTGPCTMSPRLFISAAEALLSELFDPSPTRSYTPPDRTLGKDYVGLLHGDGARPKNREIVDCGLEPG